jgi:hypothetical protein
MPPPRGDRTTEDTEDTEKGRDPGVDRVRNEGIVCLLVSLCVLCVLCGDPPGRYSLLTFSKYFTNATMPPLACCQS